MLQKLYIKLFLFVSIICYVSPILQGLDTKPFYLMLAIPLAILGLRQTNKYDVFFIYAAVFSILLFVVFIGTGVNPRGPLQYCGFLLLFFAFKYIYEKGEESPISFIKLLVALYFLAGLIQVVVGPESLSSVIATRTTEDRGVTSLTPEPAIYGLMLILAGLLLFISNEKVAKYWYVLIVIQLFIFSQSALAILAFILILNYFLFLRYFRYFLVAFSVLLVSLMFIDLENASSGRLFVLLNKLLENPSAILMLDASLNERVAHIVLPIWGVWDNYGLPGGFNSFYSVLERRSEILGGVFWWGGPSNIIMSGFSSVVFELGVVGLLFLVSIFGLIFASKQFDFKTRLFIMGAISIVMFQAIPILNPLFAWLLCATYYGHYLHEKN